MAFNLLMRSFTKKKDSVKRKGKKKKKATEDYSPDDLAKIQERSYYIWERKGRPAFSEDENWIEAEQELRDESLI
ncbi:MAG: DUF2934 domain-containing protein [bacterium]